MRGFRVQRECGQPLLLAMFYGSVQFAISTIQLFEISSFSRLRPYILLQRWKAVLCFPSQKYFWNGLHLSIYITYNNTKPYQPSLCKFFFGRGLSIFTPLDMAWNTNVVRRLHVSSTSDTFRSTLGLVESKSELISPFHYSFFCYVPDFGTHVTRPYQGLSLSPGDGKMRGPANEVAKKLAWKEFLLYNARDGVDLVKKKYKCNQSGVPLRVSRVVPQTPISATLNHCCAGLTGICTRNI